MVIHLLDNDGNTLETKQQFISQGANVYHHISTELEVSNRAAKFAVLYVANESRTDVYFDDLALQHDRLVWQENSYYPFGLAIKPLDHEYEGAHRFTYNGKELDETTGWLEFEARMHDPQLGRFHALDPRVEEYSFQSPFVYAANDPVKFIEVRGEGPGDSKENIPKFKNAKVITNGNPISFDCKNCKLFKIEKTGVDGISHEQGLGNAIELQFTVDANDSNLDDFSFDIKREAVGTLTVDGKVVGGKNGDDGPHEGNKQTDLDDNNMIFSADGPHVPNRALEHPSVKSAEEIVMKGSFTETATITHKETGKVVSSISVKWETKTVIRKDKHGKFQIIKDESFIRQTK